MRRGDIAYNNSDAINEISIFIAEIYPSLSESSHPKIYLNASAFFTWMILFV